MYLVENGKINAALNFELIAEPHDKEGSALVMLPPLCEFKITCLQQSKTVDIMNILCSMASQFKQIAFIFQKCEYNIYYKITWEGMPEEAKHRLSKMNLPQIEKFLGIDQIQLMLDLMKEAEETPFYELMKMYLPLPE